MDPNYFAAMLLVPFSFALGMMISVRSRVAKMVLALAAALVGMTIFLAYLEGPYCDVLRCCVSTGTGCASELRTVAVWPSW